MIPSKPINHSSSSTNSVVRWFEYAYYSNLLIGLAAAFLGWQTALVCGIPIKMAIPRLVLLFCTTFSFYCLHDYFTKYRLPDGQQQTPRIIFWKEFGLQMRLPFAAAVIAGGIIAIFYLNFQDYLLVVTIATMCLFYSFPFLPFPGIRRWKNHAILKLVVLAGIWTIATIWLVDALNTDTRIWVVAGNRLAFMLMICIPFDVRDAQLDKQHMHKTLLDWPGANILTFIILLNCVAGILLPVLFWNALRLPPFASLFLAIHFALTASLVLYTMRHAGKHKLYLLLDLQMIIQPLIVGLCYLLA